MKQDPSPKAAKASEEAPKKPSSSSSLDLSSLGRMLLKIDWEGRLEARRKRPDDTHAAATATECGLDHHRETKLVNKFLSLRELSNDSLRTWDIRVRVSARPSVSARFSISVRVRVRVRIPSEPGMIGTSQAMASSRAAVLEPICSTTSADGPQD